MDVDAENLITSIWAYPFEGNLELLKSKRKRLSCTFLFTQKYVCDLVFLTDTCGRLSKSGKVKLSFIILVILIFGKKFRLFVPNRTNKGGEKIICSMCSLIRFILFFFFLFVSWKQLFQALYLEKHDQIYCERELSNACAVCTAHCTIKRSFLTSRWPIQAVYITTIGRNQATEKKRRALIWRS